ncbi:RagB/SusD family nutrient uptake outer membrane protein [soil metagenome]
MKRLFNQSLTLFLVSALTIFSCDEKFLDVKVQGGETVDLDPNLAQKLVTGVYNSLTQGDCFGNGDVHGWGLISVTCTISDDADKGSTLSDQAVPIGDIDNFTLTATNKFCETIWSGHYNGVGASNQALVQLTKSTSIEAKQLKIYQAEVRFIRGYLYFNLVRMFGDVPLVLRVPKDLNDAGNDLSFVTRAPSTVVYDSIARDLQFAIDNLPLRTQSAAGHVNKGTAQTLLAKVYLYQKQWAKSQALTDAVIASGQYALVNDYATIWRQVGDNNIESIFEIESGKFNNGNFGIDNYVVSQGPRVGGLGGWDDLGYGFNGPTPNLISAYETDDKRKNATVIFIDNSGTHKGTILWDGRRIPSSDSVQNLYYNYKAYTSVLKESYANPNDKNRPKNIHILRYAEVLLMNAEAAFHTGTGDALGKVNLIRGRAGLLPKGSVTLDDIWKERRLEFAMEHDRFWDLVRQGRAGQVMRASGKTNFVDGKHELLPVPNSQILLSGNRLTQNPGY